MRHGTLAVRIFYVLLTCTIASATADSQETISGKRGDKLTAEAKDTARKAEASVVKMSKYMKDCRAAGVPLPPVWGDGGWARVGSLPADKSFDGDGKPVTEVWTHTADSGDSGICYALPRLDKERSDGGKIQLLGIICQGSATSKACFWDNIKASNASRIIGSDTDGMDPADIQGGDTLGEVCTECHRGENVFNIYPGTDLTQAGTSVSHPPYSPVAQSGWTNPPRDYTLPSGKCTSCHQLPKLSSGYCGALKGVIETKIMPLLEGESMSAFLTDVDFLAKACNALAPGLNWVFDEAAQKRLGYKP